MDPTGSALIDFTEAAYDVMLEADEWLRKLLDAGAPVIDQGLGLFALTCMRPPQGASFIIDQLHARSAPDDLAERVMRLQSEIPPSLLWRLSRPTMPKTLSEAAEDDLEALNLILRYFDFAKDGLGMSAFDPNGHGVYLIAPLPKVTTLTEKARERWQMLAAPFLPVSIAGQHRRAQVEMFVNKRCQIPLLVLGLGVLLVTCSITLNRATSTSYRTGYHQLQVNLAYLF